MTRVTCPMYIRLTPETDTNYDTGFCLYAVKTLQGSLDNLSPPSLFHIWPLHTGEGGEGDCDLSGDNSVQHFSLSTRD